ncbi:hypothetical protein E2C01_055738 [Portunus trituberculatus]|uniref:Uncharacterized protein n=1 Tax=Portunus trituberculatus TaxID=210409 RepID=A0A5B7GVJ9_PORTR|nr:hypothetical protein [Portunus trituberculatus]
MVYIGEGGERGWGSEVGLPSPGSEPPPPYSPPRVPPHHHFFSQGFPPHHHHHHHHYYPAISDYFPLAASQPPSLSSLGEPPSIKEPPPPYASASTLKAAHAALNHGPSSAFSPPPKTIKYSYPPPYTSATPNSGSHPAPEDSRHRTRRTRLNAPLRQEKSRHVDQRDVRGQLQQQQQQQQQGQESSGRCLERRPEGGSGRPQGSGHPQGPLRRTGKSLELPRDRVSHQPPPPTAHTHPSHPRLAPSHPHPHLTKEGSRPLNTKEPSGTSSARSKSNHLAYVGILPAKPRRVEHEALVSGPPRTIVPRGEERRVARASRLEAAAAQTMTAARAVPVTTISGQTNGGTWEGLGRGRLRSCRSLDELSDLLEEEAGPARLHLHPAATRSLDDLTEPFYENFDVINAHANSRSTCQPNNSTPDLLEPPPRPPRHRNNSLSSLLDDLSVNSSMALGRRALNTSVPDVLEGGTWGSPASTLRSTASGPIDATSDISVQLQKIREVARVLGVKYRRGELSSSTSSSSHTSPRVPSTSLSQPLDGPGPGPGPLPLAPGVPARAPIIHDVLRDGRRPALQTQPTSNTTMKYDADAASQESGYGSVDSRCYRQHQRKQQQQQQQHQKQHQKQQQQKEQQQQQRSPQSTQHPTRSHHLSVKDAHTGAAESRHLFKPYRSNPRADLSQEALGEDQWPRQPGSRQGVWAGAGHRQRHQQEPSRPSRPAVQKVELRQVGVSVVVAVVTCPNKHRGSTRDLKAALRL